ncbi:glycosyltransferase family 4 protein [Consotaella salsifontis]|uniref:Glycosyltransferase Family 4 n=1 Tax=Consotaella salsifontis TaxID=1365950 RepID=A0A1T4SYD3_9HYPH|nr:glycosyltransferase family 1 protein [Consotaella salsifontis]SKA32911.1 Glycosyltransferase Family 4 [Consotaella salsifontis]
MDVMHETGRTARPGLAPVAINGRFLVQPVTGVQRYAGEILRSLDRLATRGEWPAAEVLVPALPDEMPALDALRLRKVGRLRGHAWEQVELPRAARGRVLLNLGNTGPIAAGRRQVVVVHDAGVFDTPESYSWRFRQWYRAHHWLITRSGARIVTVSQFSRQRLSKWLGIPGDRILVVGEGADHILNVLADDSVLNRNELRPRQYALVVGNRVAHKGLGSLRGIAGMLDARGMTLAIAGTVDPAVFRSGVDGVEFPAMRLGRVSDGELRALLENAACLLFPSRYEGFGLPPVEALACGCPVIAAGGSAVEEICGAASLVYDPAVPGAVESTLERLLNEVGLADDLRRRGGELAARLTWDVAARDLTKIIDTVAAVV